jgi:hypothetical protein
MTTWSLFFMPVAAKHPPLKFSNLLGPRAVVVGAVVVGFARTGIGLT